MPGKRTPETNDGIQGETAVEVYNQFARNLRDNGLSRIIKPFIQAGIRKGKVLEIGSGPDYVGLEWLKMSPEAELIGLDISPNMNRIAEKNASEYGLKDRVKYVTGNSMELPFPDNTFDGVFSSGSMHEWEFPEKVLNEIHRVLKPGGKFCISDMRRDMNPFIKFLASNTVKPKEIRHSFRASMNASYTINEFMELLKKTNLKRYTIAKIFMGVTISGEK